MKHAKFVSFTEAGARRAERAAARTAAPTWVRAIRRKAPHPSREQTLRISLPAEAGGRLVSLVFSIAGHASFSRAVHRPDTLIG